MKVKVINVNNSNSKGFDTIGKIGNVINLEDRLMINFPDNECYLHTSKIKKITVETKNSTYELEVINE